MKSNHHTGNNVFIATYYDKVKHLFQRKSKKKKTKETGRSMVEVLAVLAVIGVLSALGVMGYRYAMTKYETNELINELRTCSAIVSTAHLYHPKEEKPDITECLGGVLDKYEIEVSEVYTYEGESKEYYEFTLHHVSDEVLSELLHMDPPFITNLKVNGKDVVDGKVTSYHKPIFIKSAYAGGDNTVTVEVPVNGELPGDIYNPCVNRANGETYCAGNAIYTCNNGKEEYTSYCVLPKVCSDGACVCETKSEYCTGGRTINQDTCGCECPYPKYWDGDECAEGECEEDGDCEGNPPCVYCGGDHKCHNFTGNFCKDEHWIGECQADGNISIRSWGCSENQNKKCEDGECVCIDDNLCTPGEATCSDSTTRKFCSGGKCPHWGYQECSGESEKGHCEDGECKFGDCTSGKKVLTFLKRLVLEPLRFITVSVLFLLNFYIIHSLGGDGIRCEWYKMDNNDGNVFNTSFVIGRCYPISQIIIETLLVLLIYFLIFFCSWKLKISKLWSIYGLFPLGVLLYFILTSHTIPK